MVCSALREDHSPMCGVNYLEVLRRLHLLNAGPCAAQQFDHAVGALSYLIIRTVVVISAEQAQRGRITPGSKGARIIGNWARRGARILGIVAGENTEGEGRVFDAPRHDATGIQGPGHGYRAVTTDSAVARLQPHYPGVRRRPQDVTRRLGVQGSEARVRCHGRRRTAARSSWGVVEIPGVAGGCRIVGGELGALRFAEDDRASALQTLHGRCAVLGNEVFVHLRSCTRLHASGVIDVFDAYRYPEEGATLPSLLQFSLQYPGRIECRSPINCGPRPEPVI